MIGGPDMRKIFLIASILFAAASLSAKQYPDSVKQASAEEPNIAYGWNFEFAGGVGVGNYLYKQIGSKYTSPHVTNKLGFPTGNATVGISYYFVPWMGIGTGAQFSTYVNKAAVSQPWVLSTQDPYGDDYTITSRPMGLTETQNIYMVEIPLALKFRARPGVCGFTATAGVKFGIPVYNSYKLSEGSFENSVYYPMFDLTMQDVPSVVENVQIPSATASSLTTTDMGPNVPNLRTLNYAAYAEIGMLIRVHQRVELAITAFANYYVNDVMNVHGTQDLGFGVGHSTGEYPMPYTTAYDGVLRTNEVETLHPWSAGLKLGIQINANRTKAQREYDRQQRKKKPVETPKDTVPEPIEEPIAEEPVDTVPAEPEMSERDKAMIRIQEIAREYNIDICEDICVPIPVFIHDTVYISAEPTPNDPVARALHEELKQSVIYFDLDKADPILKPEDILERIADVLRRHPDLKIHINGHACKLGKPAYNKRLALRRANAVADKLRALGVADIQMIITSLGSEVPFRYNGKHQLSKDRRVEIVPNDRMTEVVKPGSRLAQIARRHYGEPEYWVFIYEANRDKIKDPSDLPVGVELVIPDLSERLKNMTETQALNEAKRLKEEIMRSKAQ